MTTRRSFLTHLAAALLGGTLAQQLTAKPVPVKLDAPQGYFRSIFTASPKSIGTFGYTIIHRTA